MKVKVKVVPASGSTVENEVTIKDGGTIADALTAAVRTAAGFKLSVGGSPADTDTVLTDGASVELTERARGS